MISHRSRAGQRGAPGPGETWDMGRALHCPLADNTVDMVWMSHSVILLREETSP